MYRQQSINFDDVRAQIDQMFPVRRTKQEAKQASDWTAIEAKARQRLPASIRNDRFSREILKWLGTDATAVGTPVKARRVYRSISYGGARLMRACDMPIPEGLDAQQWAKAFVAGSGLCLELLNSAGEVVAKVTPSVNTSKKFW